MALKNANFEGYIFVPYVLSQPVSVSDDEAYNNFKKHYKELHKLCPKCGESECFVS